MTPQELAILQQGQANSNLSSQNQANVPISQGSSYNPLEHTAAENYAQQQAMNQGLISAKQNVPLNNANLQGNLASGNAEQNEFDYQKMNPYVRGGSKNNPQVFQRTGSLNQQASGGDFVPGQTVGGIAPNPGQTTIFRDNPPANTPQSIPVGDVKKPGDKVTVQDSKGKETQLKDTDKIVVRQKPQVNLFDFLEAAAAGTGGNPNKKTALNERMANYYNQLDEDQKASLQQQYAEHMAAINQKNELQKMALQYAWEQRLRMMGLYGGAPPQVAAGMAAQDVVGGK